jgi:hypothetical protein
MSEVTSPSLAFRTLVQIVHRPAKHINGLVSSDRQTLRIVLEMPQFCVVAGRGTGLDLPSPQPLVTAVLCLGAPSTS